MSDKDDKADGTNQPAEDVKANRARDVRKAHIAVGLRTIQNAGEYDTTPRIRWPARNWAKDRTFKTGNF